MERSNEDSEKSKISLQELEHLDLLLRISNGLANKEDLAAYNAWCNSLQKDVQIPDFSHTQSDMFERINRKLDHQPVLRKLKVQKFAAAAAILITLSAGLLFYFHKPVVSQTTVTLKGADVTPGRSSATLTLADGRKIVLAATANGQLAKESGVSITKNEKGELIYEISDLPVNGKNAAETAYNILSTTKGEQYQVQLPDGSKVWLNAASSLKYPSSFSSMQQRKVELIGEAYFEVAKDKIHPFIVTAKGQQIEVLGTHFNINAYNDETTTKTTLLEGSIKVNDKITIKPGEQASGEKDQLIVNKVDVDAATDWTNGDFIFNEKEDFKSAMRKIARWYDVEIIYDPLASTNMELRGWISRKNKLSVVLQRIASTGKVHFNIEGRRVTVTK